VIQTQRPPDGSVGLGVGGDPKRDGQPRREEGEKGKKNFQLWDPPSTHKETSRRGVMKRRPINFTFKKGTDGQLPRKGKASSSGERQKKKGRIWGGA